MIRLNLLPAEFWRVANRAAPLYIPKADEQSPKGFLCELDGHEIYLDNDAPTPNPDWDVVDALLAARGV